MNEKLKPPDLTKELLTKTFGQRYQSASERQKIFYWVVIAIAYAVMAGGWIIFFH